MRITLFLFSTLFLALAVMNGEEYADSRAGFTYDVPPDWVLRDVGNSKFKVAFGKMSEGGPANIGIIVTKCESNLGLCAIQNLNDMAKLYEKSGFTNFRVIDTHAFETAHNQVGVQGTLECKRIDGKLLRQSLYFFERKDGVKLVVSCSAVDVGDSYDATFDQILKSFRVTF